MLMRKLFVVVGPLLLCLLTCLLFRWLDALSGLGSFFQFALKGVLLGVGLALMLPVGGISHRNTGLTGWLFAAAGLKYVLLVTVLLAPGTLLYFWSRREQNLQVFTRAELTEACFPNQDVAGRTVDSHVSHLRRKLEGADAAGLLTNVRGVGYRLEAEA